MNDESNIASQHNTLVTEGNKNYKDVAVPDQGSLSVTAKEKGFTKNKEVRRSKTFSKDNRVRQMPIMDNFLEEEKKDVIQEIKEEEYPVVIPPDNSSERLA